MAKLITFDELAMYAKTTLNAVRVSEEVNKIIPDVNDRIKKSYHIGDYVTGSVDLTLLLKDCYNLDVEDELVRRLRCAGYSTYIRKDRNSKGNYVRLIQIKLPVV